MSNQYVGRVSLKHFEGVAEYLATPELEARSRLVAWMTTPEFSKYPCSLFVYEEGEEGQPHLHFYLESNLQVSAVSNMLKRLFSLPPNVRHA